MRVWRIERADDGVGVFYGGMSGTTELGALIPSPYGDGIYDNDVLTWDYRYAFPQPALPKVLRYFTGRFIHTMAKESYRVTCFDVPDEAVSMGKSGLQCVFDLRRAERVSNGATAL